MARHLIQTSAAALLGALTIAGATTPAARADVSWLCRPRLANDPCTGDQTTTYTAPDGATRVGKPEVPGDPPIDCFYVYPTTSNQPTPNATKAADPEIRSIAKYQAQRFSTRCRVFAPLYRQVTTSGVATASQTRDTSGYELALGDVREAFAQYLREDNRGRGFILVGHSQGSRLLRALIRRDIDAVPEVRERLVSAIIPGANVTVARGRLDGGDFRNIPACTAGEQTGCVISWHTFNQTPPDNARFGRTDTDPFGRALDLPAGPEVEALCSDPTALARSGGRLDTLVPTEPFAPGVINALLFKLYRGPPPTGPTPWLQPRDHYTARCERSNGANVLMIAPVAGARMLDPSPDATWGVHLVDLNIAMGNLVTIAGAQAQTYVNARRPLAATFNTWRLRRGFRRLSVTVTGPPGRVLAVALRRGGRTVARGRATLAGGRGRVRFTVKRRGRYRAVVRGGGASLATRTLRLR